ncbi:Family 4 glycosyl hydrolase [Caldanaerobius fijiensis DSM 17918]|uniref:Family 4 glycosyl hydrolase n=1 Tax=Caldanaerobius fijiensis DSM 17918 TaxID=1121256 RepID=A0A1M5D104_9THEO|nr:Family 4 glycosyl hydrolase [Caldanaerobius fijiensis DSM 17918]
MKITVIGAGSFVFGPTVLKDAIIKNRLDDCELALVDINKELVDLMASVGKRIARENNVSIKITSTTRREEALEGADFVISSAAIQGIKRWLMDYEVLKKYGLMIRHGNAEGLEALSILLGQ